MYRCITDGEKLGVRIQNPPQALPDGLGRQANTLEGFSRFVAL